jgi:hypothetical protein
MVSLAAGATKPLQLWADVELLDPRRPHGWMLVELQDPSGVSQADLLALGLR